MADPAFPPGWTVAPLHTLVDVLDSRRVPVNNEEREKRVAGRSASQLVPYYGATGQVGHIDTHIFDEDLVLLGEDGVLFLNSTKRKAYQVHGKTWVNNHAHVLRAVGDVTSNVYLTHFLNSFNYAGYVTGTTRLKLTQAAMNIIPVALPPLQEQERIVAKLEELFSRLDAGLEAVKRTQALLKRYRQSVLRDAVTGELSREWREQNPATETGTELLARMLEERRARWVQSGRKGIYKEPQALDAAGLPELPPEWGWASIGQAFEVAVGATPSRARPEFWGGDIPWVSSGEVAFCRIRGTRETITPAGYAATSTTLHPPGTVLMGMIGEGRTRGQVAILDIQACNNQNSAAIRVADTPVIPEFVYHYLTSRYEESRRASAGNNQKALNKSRIETMPVPLPPVQEQAVIVSEVERRLSIIDEMEASLAAEVRRAESLRQSILHRAFTGRLVPQDPTDEPASELLKRIQAERAAVGGGGRGRAKGSDAASGSQEGHRRPRKAKVGEQAGDAGTAGQKRGRGRPRKGEAIPEANTVEEAIRLMEARKVERAEGTRMVALFGED